MAEADSNLCEVSACASFSSCVCWGNVMGVVALWARLLDTGAGRGFRQRFSRSGDHAGIRNWHIAHVIRNECRVR